MERNNLRTARADGPASRAARAVERNLLESPYRKHPREAHMQIGVESSRSVENKRVFVIDSDEITRAVLQFMLHDENETHELASVADAYAKAVDWKPDVILLGMPIVESQGIGVVGEIRARIPGAKVAIVAETSADPTAQSCLKQGAQSLLVKPLTIESVRRKVDILLGRRTSLAIPVQLA
jgi:DNA-binding NtrC family response regulator